MAQRYDDLDEVAKAAKKQSGAGREQGRERVLAYTELKSVIIAL